MPDAPPADDAPAVSDAPAPVAAPDPPAGDGSDDALSLEAARELRREAQALRRRLKEAEAKVHAHEAEKLTVEERLTKRVAELEAERDDWQRQQRTQEVRTAAQAAAVKAGALDPLVVARLVDADTDDVAAAVRQLKAEHPRLFGPANGSADGGAGGRGPSGSEDMNALLRAAAGRG